MFVNTHSIRVHDRPFQFLLEQHGVHEVVEERLSLGDQLEAVSLAQAPAAHEPRRVEHAEEAFTGARARRPERLQARKP